MSFILSKNEFSTCAMLIALVYLRQSVTDEDGDLLTSCKQVVFNPAHRHIVLVVFAVEIHMMDLDVDLTIGVIRLDRASPNFVKVTVFVNNLNSDEKSFPVTVILTIHFILYS